MSPYMWISSRLLSSPGSSRPISLGADSNTPPRRFSTSANASSSSAVALVPGTCRPSGTVCRWVLEVENPSAPATSASSTIGTIAAMSSAVAGASSRDRSPIAASRTAQWPTMPPTLTPFGSPAISSRYSP